MNGEIMILGNLIDDNRINKKDTNSFLKLESS